MNTNVDQDLDAPRETTLAIFRIFQEAVSNAARHGGADVVNVEASRTANGGVEFRVSDNGTGFSPDEKNPDELIQEGKRGLSGMRRRVELLEGDFSLWSEPGHGTTITVTIGGDGSDTSANGNLQGQE